MELMNVLHVLGSSASCSEFPGKQIGASSDKNEVKRHVEYPTKCTAILRYICKLILEI